METEKKAEKNKNCGQVSHFALLKTKGSASFSLASRSVSDSRRLKVKLAVGSVYTYIYIYMFKKKDTFSPAVSEPYLYVV